MLPSDLAAAAPGAVLVGLLPGVLCALVVLPRLRWYEIAAVSPGLAAGVDGLTGLVWHDAHIPYRITTVVPVYAVLAVAAWWRVGRRGAGTTAPAATGRPLIAVLVAAALAGLVSAALVAHAFRDRAVPLGGDAAIHAEVAHAIQVQHDTLAVLPSPVDGSTWYRPRTAFEAEAALVAEAGGSSAVTSMLPVALLAVLLLPLGLALMVLETAGAWPVAALAPLLAVGVPMPTYPVAFGEFPLIMDATLVAPLVVVIARALRDGVTGSTAAFVTVAMAAIWVVHGLEALTLVAVGGPLFLALVWRGGREAARRLVGAGAAAGAGALAVTVLTRPPSLAAGTTSSLSGAQSPISGTLLVPLRGASITDLVRLWLDQVFASDVLVILLAVGVAAAILTRRLRWMVAASALLLVCFVDATGTGHAARLWNALFPWSVPDRLASVQYWVVPPLMAFGLVTAASWAIARAAASGMRRAGAAVVALASAASAATVAVGTGRVHDNYATATADASAFTDADERAIDVMATLLPPGSTVLTDGPWDSGQWVPSLTDDVLFMPTVRVQQYPDDLRLVRLQDACSDPAAAAAVLQGVDAVFVGSDPHASHHPWRYECLARVPNLSPLVVVRQGDTVAAAFRVRTPG